MVAVHHMKTFGNGGLPPYSCLDFFGGKSSYGHGADPLLSLMWYLVEWPAGQWGSRQEGVQMSRKIVYVQCIFITQKWSKHLFSAVMRHCKERSIVYLALLGLHLKTLPEAQRKQDIVWVWNLVTTFAILYTLSSYSSTTFSMTTITSPIWHKNILSPTWSQTMQFLH